MPIDSLSSLNSDLKWKLIGTLKVSGNNYTEMVINTDPYHEFLLYCDARYNPTKLVIKSELSSDKKSQSFGLFVNTNNDHVYVSAVLSLTTFGSSGIMVDGVYISSGTVKLYAR